MAVPTSGSISMRGVARERRYNDVGVNGYSSGSTVNLTNISMYDLMRGGNANGSDYTFCPPMDNLFPVNGLNVVAPYDPNLEQGSGVNATPYALSEFRGHVGNRELGCVKVNYNTACLASTATFNAAAAGQSYRLDSVFNYTPKGTGALIYMSINQSWAGLSTSSSTTSGTGSTSINFSAASGTITRYLNVATNSNTSSRTLTLSIYASGSCYSSDNFLHTITVTQAAASGGGGGGGLPGPGGGSQ
jgi:hypothetical protein